VLDVVEKICSRALIIHKGSLIADGTLDSLRASTGQGSLEDVFRTLTHSANVEPGVARIVAALRS
jgi:ABC-2 type transport system ATP-binding protein